MNWRIPYMKDNRISKELARIKTPDKSKEKMYKEISKKVSYQKKRFAFIWTIPTIAAVIVLAIVLVPQIINNNKTNINIEQTGTLSDAIDNKDINRKATLDSNMPIIEGTNGIMNDEVPNPGDVYISPTLEDEMNHYSKDEVLFHVRISIYFDITDLFTYEGKTMDEYRRNPVIELYNEQYKIWKEEIYKSLNQQMTAAEQNGEEYAQGWEKHSPDDLFKDYWYDTQSEEIITKYELAWEQYDKADKAYIAWTDSNEPFMIKKEIYDAERRRLNDEGYKLEVKTNELTGLLTSQQIKEFSASDQYGYIIMWADGDNFMND